MGNLTDKLKDSISQLPAVPATAQELSDEMRECQIQEFGPPDDWNVNTRTGDEPSPVCPFPSLYFLGYVVASLPQGGIQQQAPRYCATGYGAAAMLKLTQANYDPDAAIFFDWPQGSAYGGGYTVNRKVPWIRSSRGTRANCGLQLEYFTHGYPPDKCLQAAMAEFRPEE